MTLMVETGTVGGNNGALSPLITTTRAEMAQVLYNLLGKSMAKTPQWRRKAKIVSDESGLEKGERLFYGLLGGWDLAFRRDMTFFLCLLAFSIRVCYNFFVIFLFFNNIPNQKIWGIQWRILEAMCSVVHCKALQVQGDLIVLSINKFF